jgi:hypothetical protein
MDQIFIQYPGLIVCGKPDLTQRKRPQALIDAEQARIAQGENSKVGAAVLEGKPIAVATHKENA